MPLPAGLHFRYHARPSDREAVRTIVASTSFFSPAEIDVAVELVDERLAKGPESGYHFVFADEGEQVRGYTCYGPICATHGSYDLYWIAVDNNYRGKGLGRILLEESERIIAGENGRLIYIETSNRGQYGPTRAFYDRCGYRVEAVLKDFYAPDDDKVIYVKGGGSGGEELGAGG